MQFSQSIRPYQEKQELDHFRGEPINPLERSSTIQLTSYVPEYNYIDKADDAEVIGSSPSKQDQRLETIPEEEASYPILLSSDQECDNQTVSFTASMTSIPQGDLEKKIYKSMIQGRKEDENNIVWYSIYTEVSLNNYKTVRRSLRYDHFKQLISALQSRYPHLIIPSIPLGLNIKSLEEKDLNERQRLIQNIINQLSFQTELHQVQLYRDFLEDESQDFIPENEQQSKLNKIVQSVVQKQDYRGGTQFAKIKNWWKGNISITDETIQNINEALEMVQNHQKILTDLLTKYQTCLTSHQKMYEQIESFKVKDRSYHYEKRTKFQFQNEINNFLENNNEFFYQQVQFYSHLVDQLLNMLEIDNNVISYYHQNFIPHIKSLELEHEKLKKQGNTLREQYELIETEIKTMVGHANIQLVMPYGYYKRIRGSYDNELLSYFEKEFRELYFKGYTKANKCS